MTEKRVARLLGGYETTIYPTALGDMWRITNRQGPAIKLLGPQGEPCVHYLTEGEARKVAAALTEIADAIAAGEPQEWPADQVAR